MIHLPWHVSVLIPARNEEQLLPRCLDSVLTACSLLPASITSDIILAVDSSTDRTREIAERKLRGHGAVVLTDAGVVGRTRSLAAKVALQRYTGPLDLCWLANTDADCSVPESWLVDQLTLAEQGVEAIAGIVDVDSFDEHNAGVPLLFRKSYLLHPDGTHPHVHGANMGVRADAYLRAGGWSDHQTGEDHDLWNRLRSIGSRHRSIGRVKVLTSGRRVGRAPLGFAGALAAHNEVSAC
jgi:cellulose synthase/poly-beta-1,6-N-acetylglucosamine synthase-like glycosyltransferase